MLLIGLVNMLRLLHPITPFITEELFQKVKQRFPGLQPASDVDAYTADCLEALQSASIMIAPYPKLISKEDVDEVKGIVDTGLRLDFYRRAGVLRIADDQALDLRFGGMFRPRAVARFAYGNGRI